MGIHAQIDFFAPRYILTRTEGFRGLRFDGFFGGAGVLWGREGEGRGVGGGLLFFDDDNFSMNARDLSGKGLNQEEKKRQEREKRGGLGFAMIHVVFFFFFNLEILPLSEPMTEPRDATPVLSVRAMSVFLGGIPVRMYSSAPDQYTSASVARESLDCR